MSYGNGLEDAGDRQFALPPTGDRYYFAYSEALAEVNRLRKALEAITCIEDEMTGPDWAEIHEARSIAHAALKEQK
jgi:hypothetical protein